MYKINSFYIFDTTLKVQKFPIPRLRFLAVFRNHSAIFPGYTGNDMVTCHLFDVSLVRQLTTKCTVDQVYCRTCGISPIILLEMAQTKARRSINFPSLAIHKVFIFFRFQVASGIIGSPGTRILCTLTVI